MVRIKDIKKIKPLFTSVITTMDYYSDDEMMNENGIIIGKRVQEGIKEYQTVIAVGTAVRDIKEGDLVIIDPTRYGKLSYEKGSMRESVERTNPVVDYQFPTIEICGKTCLSLQDRDIKAIIEDYDVDEPKKRTDLFTGDSVHKPKIIV